MLSFVVRVFLAAAVLAGTLASAGAQQHINTPANETVASLEQRRTAIFAAMLDNPTDLDIAFEYALLSAQVGDYEGAIATLERMLIFAPNATRLKLELGVLYYRIGSFEMARSYLEGALLENPPPAVRARVKLFLNEVSRADRRFAISGSLFAGGRYQSNATAAPDADIVNINGIPLRLDQNARAQADGNLYGLADIHIAYDLRNQNDLLEANFVTYNALFADINRLNLNLFEAQVGPSFGFGRFGFDGTRLGVYAIGGTTFLGNALYTTQAGAGVRLVSALSADAVFRSRNEFRVMNYHNSASYPTVRLQTGNEWATTNELALGVTSRLLTQLGATARRVNARADFKSYYELGASLRGTYYFDLPQVPIFSGEAPWSVSLAVGGVLRSYDEPDVLLNAAEAEENEALWVEAGVSAPLGNQFSAYLTGQYRRQWSNYQTRDYDNATLSVGLSKRF
ncbi:MAG: tetratricopeptide repeat protein [Pseudomonadota bacterium]